MNSTTSYGYDGLSRLVSVTQPLGQTVRYEWDPRDRLAKKILARSSLGGSSEHPEIRYTYETWGPLAFARHYAKSSDTTPLKTISYVRNRAGDLTSVADDSIQAGPLYTYEVDPLGRTTKTFAKYIPGGDRRLDYAFDARGDLTTFTLNEPNEVLAHVYTYAADSGRIATALFPGESTALTIARWPHDGVKSIDYPGGVRREVDYDVRGPVSEIRIKPPSGTPLIEKWTYTYTDVGNVATMTDGASRQTTYQYDALDRLTQADHPAMPAPLDSLPDVENFTYDGVGNRTMSGYAHDANHRMRASPGHTYDYDDDGNLVVQDPNTPGQVTRTWDLGDRTLVYSSPSTSADYIYDSLARRIGKTIGSTTTWFLWDGRQLLANYNSSGGRTARFANLDSFSPIEVATTIDSVEVIEIVHFDRLETPRLLTDALGAGSWKAAYQGYGKAYQSTGVSGPFSVRLPGQFEDAESGDHYNQYRYYNPESGVYTSRDPVNQAKGWTPYSYTGNPVVYVDPLGLDRYLLLVGDPGLGGGTAGHDAGRNFERAAETRAAELRASGHDVEVTRVSSVDDINKALGSGATIDGGAEYFGHGWQGRLYPGENPGPATNVDASNVGTLSGANLGPNARLKLYSCKGGAGGAGSIAQLLATQLGQSVSGYESSTSFSSRADGYGPSAPGSKPPETGPLYVRPVNGAKTPKEFQP